jgi:mRNA interferase MazF
MKRGEIWTVSGAGYAGKPRPAMIVQDDRFSDTSSVAICIFTTFETDAPLARLAVAPSVLNGLREPCHLMVDKITTVPRRQMGALVGQLEPEIVRRLDHALIVFLGLAQPRRPVRRARR